MSQPFVIEISREGAKLKIAFNESGFTLKHYNELEFSEGQIAELSNEITELLNQANRSGTDSGLLKELKATGGRLYDELLTNEVKEKLHQSQTLHLILYLDETLIQIPWELLHDGEDFFCLKYALGRWVRTKQKPLAATSLSNKTSPLRMLILADPKGDLKQAAKEGLVIREDMDRHRTKLLVDSFSGDIDLEAVKKNIRDYNIVHFAGHADYDSSNPARSGWLFKDGKLSAKDITDKLGSSNPFPAFVFSNACESARTDEWQIKLNFEDNIYGLANAFLLAGAKHYIGSFWKVADGPGSHFAREFYRQLVNGASIGEALTSSRNMIFQNLKLQSLVWASFVLYGDPSSVMFPLNPPKALPPGGMVLSRGTRYLIAVTFFLIALLFLIYLFKGSF